MGERWWCVAHGAMFVLVLGVRLAVAAVGGGILASGFSGVRHRIVWVIEKRFDSSRALA